MKHFSVSAVVALAVSALPWAGAQAQPSSPSPGEVRGEPGRPGGAARPVEPLRFDIFEFAITGNTLLPERAVEEAVLPFLGEGRTIADAEGARRALEKAYQDAGYLSVVVELPPQRVGEADGDKSVALTVIEAPVDKLRVSGAQYFLPSQVRAEVPSLAPGRVPNFQDMQEELGAAASRAPDREITPLIASGQQPGTIDVDLKVNDKLPVSGFVELNSRQQQNTKRGRLEANLSYDNLFQLQHGLGAYWIYSPLRPSEVNIISLNYNLPLGGPGDRLFMLVSHSNTNTPTTLGGAAIGASLTRGETYDLRWRNQLRAFGSFQHAATWGLQYRHTRDRNRDDLENELSVDPPLRYPVFSVAYELTDFGSTPGRLTTFDIGLNVGLGGLGSRTVDCDGRQVDQFECKRAGARPTFQVGTLGVSHREPVFGGWSLYGRLQSQFASGPLVSAEQFVQGGIDSVRGYFEGEQSADMGVALRAELGTPAFVSTDTLRLSALAFYDRALLRRLQALPEEPVHIQMGSYGLGLRFESRFGLTANLDWAVPVFDTSKLDPSGLVPVTGSRAGRRQRWDLSVRQSF